MNSITPDLTRINRFLEAVKPMDRTAAGSLTDVETVGSLARRVSLIDDFDSHEWQNDLLPRIIDLVKRTSLRMLSDYLFGSWGLPSAITDDILGTLSETTQKEISWRSFLLLLDQTEDPAIQLKITLACLPAIHETLNSRIECFPFDEEARYEIAKKGAALEDETVSENIQRFKIKDEEKRCNIAKISLINLKDYHNKLCKYIERYEIADGKKRFELAELAATDHQNELYKYFKNFHILDESDRFALLKWMMKNDYQRVNLLSHFYNFDLEDRRSAIEFIKIYPRGGNDIDELIYRFDLTPEERLEVLEYRDEKDEIAKLVDPLMVPQEEARIQFFRHSLSYKLYGSDSSLVYYQVQNRQALLSLAELHARKIDYSSNFSDQIKLYKIEKEDDRIQLAKTNIERERFFSLENLKNFDIQDLKPLFARYFIAHPVALNAPSPNVPVELAARLKSELHFLETEEFDEEFMASRSPLFRPIYERIQYQGLEGCKNLVQMQMRIQILHFYHDLSNTEIDALEQLSIALHDANPTETYFSEKIFFYFFERNLFDSWFRSLPRSPENALLTHCLVPSACFSILGSNKYLDWISGLKNMGHIFCDRIKLSGLLTFLELLHKHFPHHKTLAEQVFHRDEDPSLRVQLLTSLPGLDATSGISSPLSLQQLWEFRHTAVCEEFQLPPVAPTHILFDKWRDPRGISHCLSMIKLLPPNEQPSKREYCAKWMRGYLTGNLKEFWSKSRHRQELIKLGVSEKLLAAWEAGGAKKNIRLNEELFEVRLRRFFKQKFHNWYSEFSETYPYFDAYINDPTPLRFEQEQNKMNGRLPTFTTENQQQLFKLCQNPTPDEIRTLCHSLLQQGDEISRRLSNRLMQLHQSLILENKEQDYELLDSTEPEDILYRVEEGFLPNRDIFYFHRWENRRLLVKDPRNQAILAWGTLRLLWNGAAKSPAILLELTESSSASELAKDELRKYALEVGEKLDLPVYKPDCFSPNKIPLSILGLKRGFNTNAIPLT